MGSPLSPTKANHQTNNSEISTSPNGVAVGSSNGASSESSSNSNPTSPMSSKAATQNGVASIADIEISSSSNNGDTWAGSDDAPSPVQPPSSASSGFSDDDSLHGDLGLQSVTMEQLIETIHTRGRASLEAEYTEIRQKPLEGTFNHARYKQH